MIDGIILNKDYSLKNKKVLSYLEIELQNDLPIIPIRVTLFCTQLILIITFTHFLINRMNSAFSSQLEISESNIFTNSIIDINIPSESNSQKLFFSWKSSGEKSILAVQ